MADLFRIPSRRCLQRRARRLSRRMTTMSPVAHPGRLLKRELASRALSANRLALDLGAPSGRITEILNGRRSISADTAARLCRHFRNRPKFLLDLPKQLHLRDVVPKAGVENPRRIRPAKGG